MENNNKLVKVYSNQSKKTRLKRNKNKFQRIWDAEKQTYVKVRKAKYAIKPKAKKVDWRDVDNSVALKRRHETPKKPKSVPVVQHKVHTLQKPETTNKGQEKTAQVKHVMIRSCGNNLIWDKKTLSYKRAA